MKLSPHRRQYKFRPYSPRQRNWREWEGWHLVFWTILIIVLAIVARA